MVTYIIIFALFLYLLMPRQVLDQNTLLVHQKHQHLNGRNHSKPNNDLTNKQLKFLLVIGRAIQKVLPFPFPIRLESYYKRLIRQSNIEKKITFNQFISIKFGSFAVIFIFFLLIFIDDIKPINVFLLVILSIIGFFLPDNVLNQKYEQYQQDLNRQFPITLTSLAVMVDAGANFTEALEEAVRYQHGAMIDMLDDALSYLKLGGTLENALQMMGNKTNNQEIHQFINLVLQSNEKGGDGLSKHLRQLSDTSWNERKKIANVKANKASAQLFLPMLLLVFPAVLILLVGPLIFSVMGMFK